MTDVVFFEPSIDGCRTRRAVVRGVGLRQFRTKSIPGCGLLLEVRNIGPFVRIGLMIVKFLGSVFIADIAVPLGS